MAEKSERNEAAPANSRKEPAEKAKKKGLLSGPLLVGGVMILEAVLLVAGFKFMGSGAAAASGAELAQAQGSGEGGHGEGAVVDSKAPVEIKVLEFKAPNKVSGRAFLYDVSIYAVTTAERQESLKKTLEQRDALIKDRVRTIIAQMDPEKLGGGSEPGLETLRRQVKYQLDEVVGHGVVEEVLVPRCIPYRADY